MNYGQEKNISPQFITKPVQLLAAWLCGLIAITGAFLGAATLIADPLWLRATLVIAAIASVPLFICCIFILQTKFRPEMLEDKYYSIFIRERDSLDNSKKIHDYIEHAYREMSESTRSLQRDGILTFSSEDEFLEKVYFFMNRAEKKIEAIDFIPPSLWINDFTLRRYLQLQSNNGHLDKVRIHIFDNSYVPSHRSDYISYIDMMEEAGFTIKFVSSADAGAPIGSVNIDDAVIVLNKNPMAGVETGSINFRNNDVMSFNKRFLSLCSKSIDAEEFIRRIVADSSMAIDSTQ